MAQLITSNNIEPSTLSLISGPKIISIGYPGDDTAASTAGGQTISLTGAGFQNGATVYVDSTVVGVSTVISSSLISFTTPAKSAGTYPLYVVNPDGGTATFIVGMQYSGTPAWSTAAGSLGTVYETQSYNYSLSATSDSAVTYAVTSGTLAAGATLSSDTGAITGNANVIAGSTTYNFTVDAVDQEQQNTSRNFSITVNPDVVTFNSPANNSLYTALVGNSLVLSLNATSLLGKSITYQANSLPGGLSVSGNSISGSYSIAGNSASIITATSSGTNKTSNITLNWSVTNPPPPNGQAAYTTAGTYSWTVPAGVTSVCVVCVGGGGGGRSGGGGGLGWKNTISVTFGQSYTVVVGAAGSGNGGGGNSYFISQATVAGLGGSSGAGAAGGGYVGDGGGNGGNGGGSYYGGGAGGAGGYTGNGGNGGNEIGGYDRGADGASGSGGGGGGGASAGGADNTYCGAGGGVGILGQGSSGGGGSGVFLGSGGAGYGGSGGTNGSGATAGVYGGGGAANRYGSNPQPGGGGAVRIIWGDNRAFPSTNTGDL